MTVDTQVLYVHAAKAISVRDFHQQVQQRCPPDTPISSDELIKLQFVPAHKSYKTAAKYTCRLEVKSRFSKGSGGRSTKILIM